MNFEKNVIPSPQPNKRVTGKGKYNEKVHVRGSTPGFFESDWASGTLQDSAATSTDRVEAMKTMLDIRAGRGRTEPYTCDEPAFNRYLTEQGIEN